MDQVPESQVARERRIWLLCCLAAVAIGGFAAEITDDWFPRRIAYEPWSWGELLHSAEWLVVFAVIAFFLAGGLTLIAHALRD